MATQTDFLGEIVPADVRTPVTILREQASLLGSKTSNVVVAKVSTTAGERFFHSFNLVVPALGNYAYQLFVIGTGVRPYPVSVIHSDLKFEGEQEFTEWLKAKLSSPETKEIISNLMAQATQ